jgi:hypothetical protein
LAAFQAHLTAYSTSIASDPAQLEDAQQQNQQKLVADQDELETVTQQITALQQVQHEQAESRSAANDAHRHGDPPASGSARRT